MTYLCKARVTVTVELSGDAETYVEVENDDLGVYGAEDVEVLCPQTVYVTVDVEFEVEAESEDQAREKAEEMLEDLDRWRAETTIGGVGGLVSTFADEVAVEDLKVEALKEAQDE